MSINKTFQSPNNQEGSSAVNSGQREVFLCPPGQQPVVGIDDGRFCAALWLRHSKSATDVKAWYNAASRIGLVSILMVWLITTSIILVDCGFRGEAYCLLPSIPHPLRLLTETAPSTLLRQDATNDFFVHVQMSYRISGTARDKSVEQTRKSKHMLLGLLS